MIHICLSLAGSEHTKSGSQKKMKRRFTLNMFGTLESGSSSVSQQTTSEDLTIEALVSVIQEPDKGVPRALTGALEDVKIHRGIIMQIYNILHYFYRKRSCFFWCRHCDMASEEYRRR